MGSSESHSILLTDVKEMRKHSKQRNRNCGMKAEGGFILHYLRPHFRSVALLSNLHLRQELGGPPKVKKTVLPAHSARQEKATFHHNSCNLGRAFRVDKRMDLYLYE